MTADIHSAAGSLNRRVGENVTTLMFRMGWKQTNLAAATGINPATLGRKLKGVGDWSVPELQAIAAETKTEASELLGDLPEFDAWRARRDSNPKPSGLVFGAPAVRHLRLVVGY